MGIEARDGAVEGDAGDRLGKIVREDGGAVIPDGWEVGVGRGGGGAGGGPEEGGVAEDGDGAAMFAGEAGDVMGGEFILEAGGDEGGGVAAQESGDFGGVEAGAGDGDEIGEGEEKLGGDGDLMRRVGGHAEF